MRTTGRWVRKRALSVLLACVMLFSSVELTAFATEPETETVQPGDGNGTAGENGATEGEDATADSDTEEDTDGKGSPADDEAGEQTPEDEADTGKDPGNSEQEEDAADGEEQDSNDPDKEDPSGSDQTEDSDGIVEKEEDGDVTDGKDENEEDGTADDAGKTEEDNTVSENSVSENSVSENDLEAVDAANMAGFSVMQEGMSLEASSSLGSMLLDGVQIAAGEEADEASQEYSVSEIEVTGKTASARVHAVDDCTMVVSIYPEGSNQPAAFGKAFVKAGENHINVEIETDSMPVFFEVKGYLVDTDSLRPLSKEYCSSMYTEAMQAFLKKTTSDFNDAQIINLDEDNKTNFIVTNDDTKLIKQELVEGNIVNELISYDEVTNTYIFANIAETIKNLQKNDTFVYQYDVADILTIKIASIRIESVGGDGSNSEHAVITAVRDELNIDDVFQYVKVEEDLWADGTEEIDPALCSEGVKFLGWASATGRAIESGGSIEKQGQWSLDLGESGPESEKPIKAEGTIKIGMGIKAEIRYYFDLHPLDKLKESIWYTDFNISCTAGIEGGLEVEGEFTVPLVKAPLEMKNDLITLKYTPTVVFGFTFSGTLKSEFEGIAGIELGRGLETKGVYATIDFKLIELSAEVNGYIGVAFNPQLKVLNLLDVELSTGIHAGVEASFETGISFSTQKDNTSHDCGDLCIAGNIYIRIPFDGKLKIWKLKEVDLSEEIGTSGEILRFKIGEFYFSIKYRDFGLGECPHQKFEVIVIVKDSGGAVSGAKVNNEKITDNFGEVVYLESAGPKMYYAVKDGITGSKLIEINQPGQRVTIKLGQNEAGPVDDNAVVQVCADVYGNNCAAITKDGRLYRWGNNAKGQLGDGTGTIKYEPVLIPFENEVQSFKAGHDCSAAVIKDDDYGNALYLWGYNSYGQLGDGTTDNSFTPSEPRFYGVDEVSLGQNYSAAIVEGKLYLWGNNQDGQIGNGESGGRVTSPVQILTDQNVKQIILPQYSGHHSAAVTEEQQLYLWGNNQYGQIGDGNKGGKVTSPTPILEGQRIKQVSLGATHTAAVTEDGRLYLWGDNQYGQIGNGKTAAQKTPWELPLDRLDNQKVKSVYLGNYCSMAVTEDGSLYAWGTNRYGEIGQETENEYYTIPQKVKGIENIKEVAIHAGDNVYYKYNVIAVLQKDGGLYMWGCNSSGEIGNGSGGNGYGGAKVTIPTKILDNVEKICLGGGYAGSFSTAVTVDGSLWTWGDNDGGQLGRGKNVKDQDIPGIVVIPEKEDSAAYALAACTANDSPQITPDPTNPVKQTAGFTGLTPNDIHNIYVMRSREADDSLGSGNLLYIGQAVSDAEGRLTVTYEMKEAYESPAVFCVGMTRTDLTAAEITLADIIYDGEEHLVEPQVVLNGRTLAEGEEYDLYGDCIVKEQGEYKIVVRGTGLYSGEKEVVFHVKEGDGGNPGDGDNPGGDDPEYGDVREEDIPADGIIPAGLWIAGISEEGYTYTGKAIRPEVRVYDNKTLLREKTDYTIVYQNNILANITTDERTLSTITVTGKGNYEGKETYTFKIMPVDISPAPVEPGSGESWADGIQGPEDAFAADDMTIAANGKAQKPLPSLYWNEKKLKNNTDYTITYYDSTGDKKLVSVKDNGSYYIRLTGKGNFTGERTVRLTVTDKLKLMSKVTVAKVKNQPYTGTAVKPALTVKDGKSVLKEGEHYTAAYSRNTAVGTAYAVVTGIEAAGYSGTKRISFKITGTSIAGATVTGLTGTTFLYGGMAHEPELTLKVRDAGTEKTLTPDVDYKTTWQKNLDAGTATVLFTGMGGYSGSLKKTFKINAFNIAENKENRFNVALAADSVPYAKGGAKPDMTVTFRRSDGSEQKLQEGRDYTVTYQNNKALYDGSTGKQPSVTVKGKGNFSGTYAAKLSYKIVPRNIGELVLGVSDPVYQNKKNAYVPKVTVTDIDGKTLKAGTDYEKTPVYTYKNDTMLDNGTIRAAGSTVDRNDIVPAGTVLKVAVTAKNGGNYTGVLEREYRITRANISKTAVTVRKQTYTGQEIRLDKSDITVRIKGKQVDESQYEIVEGSYKNNVRKGTASVTIRGVDNYGGTKTIKFSIKAKGFLWWWRK